MVAVDGSMNPVEVPQFTPSNEEEQTQWDAAQRARDAMR